MHYFIQFLEEFWGVGRACIIHTFRRWEEMRSREISQYWKFWLRPGVFWLILGCFHAMMKFLLQVVSHQVSSKYLIVSFKKKNKCKIININLYHLASDHSRNRWKTDFFSLKDDSSYKCPHDMLGLSLRKSLTEVPMMGGVGNQCIFYMCSTSLEVRKGPCTLRLAIK